jgi:PTS system mannose-specific IIA component
VSGATCYAPADEQGVPDHGGPADEPCGEMLQMTVGILILTHGDLARELLASARKIAGELDNFEALPLSWSDGVDKAQEKVGEALQRVDRGAGVLILTDIFGGTPSNIAMAFRKPGRVEVISGVNLPMVVRLGCLNVHSGSTAGTMALEEMASWIREKAQTSICCSSEMPRPPARKAGAPAPASEDGELPSGAG